MKHVTPFTAVRGLIATALTLPLVGVVLLLLPLILAGIAVVFVICILNSDSFSESWEMFSSEAGDMMSDVADAFRGLGKLWVTEARQ